MGLTSEEAGIGLRCKPRCNSNTDSTFALESSSRPIRRDLLGSLFELEVKAGVGGAESGDQSSLEGREILCSLLAPDCKSFPFVIPWKSNVGCRILHPHNALQNKNPEHESKACNIHTSCFYSAGT